MFGEAKELSIVEGATHLFPEPGKIEEASKRAGEWFHICFDECAKEDGA